LTEEAIEDNPKGNRRLRRKRKAVKKIDFEKISVFVTSLPVV
jgi:hypothetical protein